ncbi:MAG TPA: tetratricopeptide repeat protein [Ferruginibacter sp.]|nr:tetratricopeptide repeat protein [Ferruginibacter sp.]
MIKQAIVVLLLSLFIWQTGLSQEITMERTVFHGDTSLYAQARETILRTSDSITREPSSSQLYFRRGYLFFEIEEWKKAKEDFTKAIAIDTNNFLYYYERGAANERLSEFGDAYDDYCNAIKLNPTSEWSYLDRGLIFQRSKMFTDAANDFRHALRIRPNWGAALFEIGSNYDGENKVDSAIYYYKKAIHYDSLQYKAYNNLGYIYTLQKKYDLAIIQFNKALKIWSGYTYALTNRADAEYAEGDKTSACADIYQAILLGREDKMDAYKEHCQ